jgi:hypothetical protein
MKKFILSCVALLGLQGLASADPFTLSPQPSAKVQVGEGGKWTVWNLLPPGQSVTIRMEAAADVTLSVRKVLQAADGGKSAPVSAQFGVPGKTTALALSAQESRAVIHKSADKLGFPEVIRQSASGASAWTLSAPAGKAPLAYRVEARPTGPQAQGPVKIAAPLNRAPVKEVIAKKPPLAKANAAHKPADDESSVGKTAFFVEPRPGFFVGKGALKGFRGELAAGYYPGILDGAFAVVVQGGYYGAKGEDQIKDADIGTVTRNWSMTAIPIGASVRWHILPGSVRPYVAGGLEYTRVSFEYTASIPAGSLQEPKVTGLNSFLGPRGAAGAAIRLGPGVLNGELAYSYAYLPADTKGDTGKILAPVVFLGYAMTFGESSPFEEAKRSEMGDAEPVSPVKLARK